MFDQGQRITNYAQGLIITNQLIS